MLGHLRRAHDCELDRLVGRLPRRLVVLASFRGCFILLVDALRALVHDDWLISQALALVASGGRGSCQQGVEPHGLAAARALGHDVAVRVALDV